jgi:hypothetical protein
MTPIKADWVGFGGGIDMPGEVRRASVVVFGLGRFAARKAGVLSADSYEL